MSSDPRSQEEQNATDEQVDSLKALYNYAQDEGTYNGVTQEWVESSAEYLNWKEITDWLAEGDDNE